MEPVAAEKLSLAELADYRLPRHSFPSDAWRELATTRDSFLSLVRALQESGKVSRRADGEYRTWHLYEVLTVSIRLSRIALPNGRLLHTFPQLRASWDLLNICAEWWEASEAARLGYERFLDARHFRSWRDPERVNETVEEWRVRVATAHDAMLGEFARVGSSLPSDEDYWVRHLRMHADAVICMRRSGFDGLARLCAAQLHASVRIAEVALGLDRLSLREKVGYNNSDLRAPALTAASYSGEWRAFDLTIDMIRTGLSDYNQALPGNGLDEGQAKDFLDFLEAVGLQLWYHEFSAVTWQWPQFMDLSRQTRVGTAAGRLRALCVLLEDMVLALAERTGDIDLVRRVADANSLRARLNVFVQNRCGASVDLALMKDVAQRCRITATDLGPHVLDDLRAKLEGLGLAKGREPGVPRGHVVEHLLATLVVMRDVAGHRVPIQSELSGPWFDEVFGDYLTSLNRSILWGVLFLWSISG